MGVNYYSKWRVTHDPGVPYLQSKGVAAYDESESVHPRQNSFAIGKVPTHSKRGAKLSPHGWEILPEGLYETLKWARERFGDYDFYVTENGTAGTDDAFTREQHLQDHFRIDYLRGHLQSAHRALAEGIKLRGYMQWSLMDNLEWASGYRIRCGMIYTDFRTQQRTLKESARWYQQVIAQNAVP